MVTKNVVRIALALCAGTCAADTYVWNNPEGGALDAAANWKQGDNMALPDEVPEMSEFHVESRVTGPLTLAAAEADLFGGMQIRYSGGLTYTNDFGAGHVLTNLGAAAKSSFHVEGGATLVHKSGAIHLAHPLPNSFESGYITENSTFVLDGPASSLYATHCFNLRSNRNLESVQYKPDHPTLIVTNGARMVVDESFALGNGGSSAATRAVFTGAGTTFESLDTTRLGSFWRETMETHFCTNRLEVTDHARAAFNKIQVGQSRCHGQLIVSDGARVRVGDVMNVGCTVESAGQVKWMTSTNLVSVRGGAALTNAEAVLVGCAPRAGIAGGVGNVLEYTGAGTTGVVLKTITPYTDNTVRVADGAVLMAAGFAFQSGGALELAGGTYTNLTDAAEVSAPGRLCGSGGAYAVAEDLTFNENARVALTNVSVSLGHYLKLKKNAALELAGADGRLAYGKLYFDRPNAELVLRDCSTLGGRVEMTQSNSVLRLENAQVTIASSDATAIFMLGDGSGNDETNVAYERHVHITGTNTHVRVRDVPNHGLFVRGSNTTMHVEIPAGGFSTVRPVFDLKKISWNGNFNPRLRVEITVDEKLPLNGGGTYTLFKTADDDSARSDSIDYVYDPAVVTIDKTVAKEVRIRVKSTRGAVLIVR